MGTRFSSATWMNELILSLKCDRADNIVSLSTVVVVVQCDRGFTL